MAEYTNILNSKDKDVLFQIYSENHIGISINASEIRIPFDRCILPNKFKSVHYNGSYHLSWEIPADDNFISGYTLFWCRQDKDWNSVLKICNVSTKLWETEMEIIKKYSNYKNLFYRT